MKKSVNETENYNYCNFQCKILLKALFTRGFLISCWIFQVKTSRVFVCSDKVMKNLLDSCSKYDDDTDLFLNAKSIFNILCELTMKKL